jgi:long-chain fatty acid transport protein
MSFRKCCLWVAVAGACIPGGAMPAQGFGISEIGSCAVGRGFAVTGSPCGDASTIFWNPAAAAELTGKSIGVGASAIDVKGAFRQDSTGHRYPTNLEPALVPDAFASMRIGRGAVGFGIYAPYGLASQWYDDFPGRFFALHVSLQTVYFQPNIAYQLNDHWSIGGGPVIGHSTVKLTQRVDLSEQVAAPGVTFGQLGVAAQTDFATAHLAGSDNAFGYNLGIHGRYGSWSVGARYLSSLSFNYSDARASFDQIATGLTLPTGNPVNPAAPVPLDAVLSAQFAPGGPLVRQRASSMIDHPWQLQAGLGYSGFANTKLSADITRIGWSAFATQPIAFHGPAASSSRVLPEDFHDSWSYRFGAERSFNTVTGRIGYSYAESPAPDGTVTPALPDMNRRNFSVGFGLPVAGPFRLDAAYLHLDTSGRRGRIAEPAPSQSPLDLNTGTYDLRADVFSAGVNVNF